MNIKFDFRKVSLEDRDLLDEMRKDEGFKKYFIPGNNMTLALLDNVVIGAYSINYTSGLPELQIGILPEHRRKGYALELTKQITNKLCEENIPSVFIRVHKENKASLACAKKCGYNIDWDNEEFNPDNKEDDYYKLYYTNPSYIRKR